MNDDFGEERANLQQIIAGLQSRLESIAIVLSRSGLDEVSLRVALAVEDQFAQGHTGGRVQRLAKIQLLIRNAVERATQGQVQWDAWSPNSCGPAPTKPVGGVF